MGCGTSCGTGKKQVIDLGDITENEDLSSPCFRVLMLGMSGVGKTSLFHRICNGTFMNEYPKTVRANIKTKRINIDGAHVSVQLVDVPSIENVRIRQIYYRGNVHGCVMVCDCLSPSSLDNVRNEWMGELFAMVPQMSNIPKFWNESSQDTPGIAMEETGAPERMSFDDEKEHMVSDEDGLDSMFPAVTPPNEIPDDPTKKTWRDMANDHREIMEKLAEDNMIEDPSKNDVDELSKVSVKENEDDWVPEDLSEDGDAFNFQVPVPTILLVNKSDREAYPNLDEKVEQCLKTHNIMNSFSVSAKEGTALTSPIRLLLREMLRLHVLNSKPPTETKSPISKVEETPLTTQNGSNSITPVGEGTVTTTHVNDQTDVPFSEDDNIFCDLPDNVGPRHSEKFHLQSASSDDPLAENRLDTLVSPSLQSIVSPRSVSVDKQQFFSS